MDHSRSAFRRSLNYISFAASSSTAWSYAREVDVIYVYATQMTAALAPWLWKLAGGAPYVLHVQDLWPDSITGSSIVGAGTSQVVSGLLTPWLSSVYHHASAVVGIAPTMMNTLIERGVHPTKAHLIYNWAEEGSRRTVRTSATRRGNTNRTNIIYAGNVGDMQALDAAVLAAHQAVDTGVHLTIIGGGVALPTIRALADDLRMTNVDFVGPVPRTVMGEFYSTADFALVSLRDLSVFRGTIPSKFQAALSHGVPVISTVQGDLRQLVKELAVGFTAEAEEANSLEAAFRAAAATSNSDRGRMASRAREVYASRFSLESGVTAIESVLRESARSGKQRSERKKDEQVKYAGN